MKTQAHKFLQLESLSGALLVLAAIAALIICNSPQQPLYENLRLAPLVFSIHHYHIVKPLLFWLNEGFMTFFFLNVALELKREFLVGSLSEPSQVLLPALCALGGMVFPAGIYLLFNYQHPVAASGWAIPVATDIAFALGVLSLFGKRVPVGLKIFLLALAIFDDVGAILIIAFYHTQHLSYLSLLLSLGIVGCLVYCNKRSITKLAPYLLLGLLLWVVVLKSGIHATLAGVILGLCIPHDAALRLEHKLNPWVAFLLMPCFAFFNAGVTFLPLQPLTSVAWGTIAGLFVGKQLGVMSTALILIKSRWAKLPENVNWLSFYAVSILCGIGFTMSLFLGTLAFEKVHPDLLIETRLAILLATALSSITGIILLYFALPSKAKED